MTSEEPRDLPMPEFTPEETELIFAEIRAIRAELRGDVDAVEASSRRAEAKTAPAARRRAEEVADAFTIYCQKTPAQLLADHERRITKLERKLSSAR